MPKQSSVSVLVTSYNQRSSLNLLFASLDRQTDLNFEVIIADDGSSDGTEALCREKRKFHLNFVTHPDEGYRKAKILNEAVRQSKGEYLIFIDGDVVLEKHFIEDHLSLRKKGHFVCGRRVDLGPEVTRFLTDQDVRAGLFDGLNWKMILSAVKSDTIGLKRSIRIKSPLMRRILGYHRGLDILGSNFSAWKADIEEVNGFNEALEAYWGEDGDLYIRLRNAGKRAIGAKSLCVQYHLYHKRREPSPENVARYHALLKNKEYKWAAKGLG